MTASAPAATAASAIGSTALFTPTPCDGSTASGRRVRARRSGTAARASRLREAGAEERHGREVEQVARSRVEGAHATLAEDDVVVTGVRDVLRREEPLLERGAH